MKPFAKNLLLWLPRVLGILFVLFTGIFSFDVFDMGLGLWGSLLAFFMHLLVPTILLAIVVALAWRWEWVGAVGFGLWALFYPFYFKGFDSFAYILMSGIPLVIASLYLVGWIFRKKIRG
jgi:hypothetical protein